MTNRELSKSLVGAVVAVAVLLALSRFTGVTLSDLYELPAQVLWISLALVVLRMAAQGLRFYLIVGSVGRVRLGVREALMMRGASEFFALTTVPFVADEAARAVMLARKGERPITAFWISTAELVVDVVVSAPLAVMSALYAASVGSWAIASAVLSVALTQLAGTAVLFAYAGRGLDGGGLMRRLSVLLPPRVRGEISDGIREMKRVLRGIVDSKGLSRATAMATASIAVAVLPSVVLSVLLEDLSPNGLVTGLYATMAGNTLGVLPISVGGAGVTEAGVYLYLLGVYGIGDWGLVLGWRLLTYYVKLCLTTALLGLYLLTLRRSGRT
ncbi:MAG: flippase-like domain-containing protein [Thaumarchaeota archaeon]|nr:flippase-like domain-containing protein [Candidatus Calditenuaceae archaeon]MDW8186743.1 hypothetical protein [Nitrososphaerota archaeon]